MNKKIVMFSETNFYGKIKRENSNLRTDLAWMVALDAIHIPLNYSGPIEENFDLAIIIIPKNLELYRTGRFNIHNIKRFCKKVCIMQEGPHQYFQDSGFNNQIFHFKELLSADFLLCHNEFDKYYYSGLTCKPTFVLPSLLIDDNIKQYKNNEKQNKVIVGGNFTSWYSGLDSTIIATEFETNIEIVSMGRKSKEEENYIKQYNRLFNYNVTHLPYFHWDNWMEILSYFKYAVHLMRTFAAGTFSLNTAYFGIPTIGYNNLDTQILLHPHTSVDLGDLEAARAMAVELRRDKSFYEECSNLAIKNYNTYYAEPIFKQQFNKIIDSIYE